MRCQNVEHISYVNLQEHLNFLRTNSKQKILKHGFVCRNILLKELNRMRSVIKRQRIRVVNNVVFLGSTMTGITFVGCNCKQNVFMMCSVLTFNYNSVRYQAISLNCIIICKYDDPL